MTASWVSLPVFSVEKCKDHENIWRDSNLQPSDLESALLTDHDVSVAVAIFIFGISGNSTSIDDNEESSILDSSIRYTSR